MYPGILDSSNATTSWVPEPKTRGTWGILSSCILTLSLCVWTAVHLNVPEYRKERLEPWQFWKNPQLHRKGLWLLLGLLAPEIVAYAAWAQRREAEALMKEVNEFYNVSLPPTLFQRACTKVSRGFSKVFCFWRKPSADADVEIHLDDQPVKPTAKSRHPWGPSHGFYGVMGGFAIDTSSHEDQFLPLSMERVTLNGKGVRFVMKKEPNLFPNISEAYIEDKSKANGLAKFLVCFQASWFCIQVVVRMAQSLPISLLELNTFAHSICTLLIYYFWWDKPLNIEEPTQLDQNEIRPLAAFMSMRSFPNTIHGKALEYRRVEDKHLDTYENGRVPPATDEIAPATNPHANAPPPESLPALPRQSIDVRECQFIPGSDLAFRFWSTPKREKYESANGRYPLHLSARTVTRWRLATLARHQYRLGTDRMGGEGEEAIFSLCTRVSDFKFFGGESDATWAALLTFVLAPAVYGGIHAVAWYKVFPSHVENVLWRVAVCFVMTASLLWIPERLVPGDSEEEHSRKYNDLVMGDGTLITKRREDAPRKGWDKFFHAVAPCIICGVVVLIVLKGVVGLGYVVARAYLVVECFIDVAHLSRGVYELPSWVVYIPHIL